MKARDRPALGPAWLWIRAGEHWVLGPAVSATIVGLGLALFTGQFWEVLLAWTAGISLWWSDREIRGK